MKKVAIMFINLIIFLFFIGCGESVYYGDPGAVETVTEDFGSTDLQMIAEKMVNSLIASNIWKPGERPVIAVLRLKNKTMEHIDTKSITDKIRTALIRSGRFRFLDLSIRKDLAKELAYQNETGFVNPSTAAKFGRQIGAQYLLYGEITSIVKERGRIKDIYYKITLNLVNVETGILEWADEKEIRKGAKKPVFGY